MEIILSNQDEKEDSIEGKLLLPVDAVGKQIVDAVGSVVCDVVSEMAAQFFALAINVGAMLIAYENGDPERIIESIRRAIDEQKERQDGEVVN